MPPQQGVSTLHRRKTTNDSGKSPRSPNRSLSSSPMGMNTSTSAWVAHVGPTRVVPSIIVDPTSQSQPSSPASSAKPLSTGSISGWLAKAAHSSGGKLAGGFLTVAEDEERELVLAAAGGWWWWFLVVVGRGWLCSQE